MAGFLQRYVARRAIIRRPAKDRLPGRFNRVRGAIKAQQAERGRASRRGSIVPQRIDVLCILDDGPERFTALRTKTAMSPQVLARTPRRLEEAGLVDRQLFAEVPLGPSTASPSSASPSARIRGWAIEHAADVAATQTANRRKRDKQAPAG